MSRKDLDRENIYFGGNEQELQKIDNRIHNQKLLRRRESQATLTRVLRAVLFIALAAVFIIGCIALFFKVKFVEVVGSSRYTEADVLAVVDVEHGENLFKYSDKDIASVYGKLTYVKRATLTRKLPNTIVITIEEDSAQYIADIYGELFLLSNELRVLEKVGRRSDVKELQLVELVLPQVQTAIIGSRITFPEEATDKYVTAYVDALASSPMISNTTAFDLRDRFDLALIAKELYLVDLGTGTELPTKLTVVAGMLEDPTFSDRTPATIDAEDPKQCSVIKKADLRVAFDD